MFHIISQKLEKSKLKNISYEKSTIYNFTFVSKNSEKIIVKGKKLIDNISNIYAEDITSFIEKNGMIIKSKTATYDKKNILKLEKNVNISTKDMNLFTDYIIINFKKNIAYNFNKNKIVSKKMITTGKNLLFNFKRDFLILKSVRTKIIEE